MLCDTQALPKSRFDGSNEKMPTNGGPPRRVSIPPSLESNSSATFSHFYAKILDLRKSLEVETSVGHP